MREKFLSFKDAVAYCKKKESHFFDRKAFDIKGKGIQKIATAFANADGGEFVIGILDEKFESTPEKRWAGRNSIEEYNKVFQALSEISPGLAYDPLFLKCDELQGITLLVRIEKSSFVHKTSDGRVYVRKSAQSLPLSNDRIIELQFAKGTTSFENQKITNAYPEDVVESNELHRFLSVLSPNMEPIEYMLNEQLIDREDWTPNAASVLLFAKNPVVIMPRKCAVKITRYETKEDDPERAHLTDQFTIEGSLYELIHNTIEKITEIMSNISIWTVNGLMKVDYPPEAIWEVVVNALIHRDYSISDDVQIHIYDNRIEVISPGKLPGYVTEDNILDARYSRNSKIVRTLNRYPNPPNKDMGEGLNTAFQKMKEWKLKSPIISEEENYVKVVIPHKPLANPEELILQFLKKNESIKNSQARDITGIKSENKVKNLFYKLREEGYIQRVPGLKGPASAWEKVK